MFIIHILYYYTPFHFYSYLNKCLSDDVPCIKHNVYIYIYIYIKRLQSVFLWTHIALQKNAMMCFMLSGNSVTSHVNVKRIIWSDVFLSALWAIICVSKMHLKPCDCFESKSCVFHFMYVFLSCRFHMSENETSIY